MNHGQAIKPRKYSDMLIGQFEIEKVVRINRKNDENTISNKIFDFSPKTIKHLEKVDIAIVWILVTLTLVDTMADIASR